MSLEITLMESDTVGDDLVDTKSFDLSALKIDETCKKTFVFKEVWYNSAQPGSLSGHVTRVTHLGLMDRRVSAIIKHVN